MSVPDPELTFQEAIEILTACTIIQDLEEQWANDIVLTRAAAKIQQAATDYETEFPGTAEDFQDQLDLLALLREEDDE